MTDTLDRIPLRELESVECWREHVDELVPVTFGQRLVEVIKFIAFGLMVVLASALLSVASAWCYFYWLLSR